MKKIAIFILLSISTTIVSAQSNKPSFNIGASAVAGYNHAWGAFAGSQLYGDMTIGNHLEVGARFEGLSSNVFSAALKVSPKINLPAGCIYLSTDLLYRNFFRSRTMDVVGAGVIGWKMEHLNVNIGMFSRIIGHLDTAWSSNEDRYNLEPFNMCYRVEAFLRKYDSKWNLYAGISNVSPFQYEIFWAPYFYLGGWYRFNDHLKLYANVDLQQSGMFHLSAQFFGVRTNIGVNYQF